MPTDTFYQTTATFCFVVQGLWWNVLQARSAEWRNHPERRSAASLIQLSFVVPGLMSLGATLTADSKALWRTVFIISAGLGIIVSTRLLMQTPKIEAGWLLRYTRGGIVVLYLLVAVLAIRPQLVKDLGIDLVPLQVEGLLLCVLIFLGVGYAWEFLTEVLDEAPTDAVPVASATGRNLPT